MLPLIGALGGAALAPTLQLGVGTAAALGSGLGSYLQTGSLEKGIMSGLGSYLGGKALGSLLGPGTSPTEIKEGLKASAVQSAAQPSALQQAMTAGSEATTSATMSGLKDGVTASGSGLTTPGFFDTQIQPLSGVPALGSSTDAVTLGDALGAGATAGTIGGALSYEPPPIDTGFGDDEPVEIPDYGPEDYAKQRTPGAGYRPGRDPEFRYFDRSGTSSLTRGLTGMASGGIMRMQEGGEINDKEVVDMAIRAVEGKIAEPEKALAEYMNRFGQEALLSLVNAVRSGEVQSSAGPAEGTVRGAGDGMDDLVPASMGEQDVLLSEGEFVVPADVVSGIGNGSTDAGAERLYGMLDRVREMRNGGSTKQPPQIRAMDALPA